MGAAFAAIAAGPSAAPAVPALGAQDHARLHVHVPVLLREAVDALLPDESGVDGVFVDGTFGRGGHTRALLARLGPHARVVAFDKDPEAVAAGRALAASDARLQIVHASFAAMRDELAQRGIAAVDGVLLDLGVSSPQLDDASRGFSFLADAPLDMRMDPTRGVDAARFLAEAPVERIAAVVRELGEERFAGPIARAVDARRRAGQPPRTTLELARLVASVVRSREPGQHPATRTFQALRIQVNDELGDLEAGLDAALALMRPGARLAAISFHSLEDRIVKRFIARESRDAFDRRVPFAAPRPLRLRAVARLRAGDDEVRANPRARSATLRVAERLAGTPADAHGGAP